jgi:hypothetical protein
LIENATPNVQVQAKDITKHPFKCELFSTKLHITQYILTII